MVPEIPVVEFALGNPSHGEYPRCKKEKQTKKLPGPPGVGFLQGFGRTESIIVL